MHRISFCLMLLARPTTRRLLLRNLDGRLHMHRERETLAEVRYVCPSRIVTHSVAEEANQTFSNLLKSELFGSPSQTNVQPPAPGSPRRPVTFHSSSAPNLPPSSSSGHTSSGSTPHHHVPPSVPDATGALEATANMSVPLHVPSTPSQGLSRLPGSAASREHHVAVTAHSQSPSQPSSSSSQRTAYSPPTSTVQTTPTRKRLFTYASPSSNRAQPLNYGIGGKLAGVQGLGLDDMGHEKYSLSPVGRESQKMLLSPRKGLRSMAKTPFKVLDAPELAVSLQDLTS